MSLTWYSHLFIFPHFFRFVNSPFGASVHNSRVGVLVQPLCPSNLFLILRTISVFENTLSLPYWRQGNMIVHKILQQTRRSTTPNLDTPLLDVSDDGTRTFMVACSAVSPEHRDLLYSRQLCEDRRGFFDHLRPKSFVKSVSTVPVQIAENACVWGCCLLPDD